MESVFAVALPVLKLVFLGESMCQPTVGLHPGWDPASDGYTYKFGSVILSYAFLFLTKNDQKSLSISIFKMISSHIFRNLNIWKSVYQRLENLHMEDCKKKGTFWFFKSSSIKVHKSGKELKDKCHRKSETTFRILNDQSTLLKSQLSNCGAVSELFVPVLKEKYWWCFEIWAKPYFALGKYRR